MVRWLFLAIVFILLSVDVTFADSAQRVPACGQATPPPGASTIYMDANGNLCTSGGGGGGGGAVTVADGADATQGAIADTAASAGGVGTLSAKLRELTAQMATLIANTAAALPAQSPTVIIGGVGTASINNAVTTPHICGSHIFKHITTATDTQILAASGSTNIYVCDYSISFNGTGNIYLEKATSGTCATLTQIDQAWFGVANAGKIASNPYYQGLSTGASAQLCANTSAAVTIDIAVNYDQY